jgi:hypothetical protein
LTRKLFFAIVPPVQTLSLTGRRARLPAPPPAYRRLQAQLARLGWLAQGSVQARPLWRQVRGRRVPKGPYYLWTAKVGGKTVCQALSRQQYQALQQAIAQHRRAVRLLRQMHGMTLRKVLRHLPGVERRK